MKTKNIFFLLNYEIETIKQNFLFQFISECLRSHGILNILDIRRNGISFPKRPEIFVLLCSSLPVVISILSRPLFYPLEEGHKFFIVGWGMAQTRFFFDLFTRTASIYHLIFWLYRTPIIHLIWRIFLTGKKIYTNVSTRCIAFYAKMKQLAKTRPTSKQKPSTKGRTSEWGYDTNSRKRRSKSIRVTDAALPSAFRMNDPNRAPIFKSSGSDHGSNSAKTNLITPQALFTGQTNLSINGMPNLKNLMNPYGISVNTGLYSLKDDENLDELSNLLDDTNSVQEGIPHPTLFFYRLCKRLIPGIIYLTAFFVTIPSITGFVSEEIDNMVIAKCTPLCQFYFLYDLIMLIIIPTLAVIIAFYYAALTKKQINGEEKFTYNLRCYYIAFVLFNLPILLLMLITIVYRWTGKPFRNIYGTGIIITMTIYHLNFALKSTIYTTGCNCICCTDNCLGKFPKFSQFLVSFTTPVAVKDREAMFEGL